MANFLPIVRKTLKHEGGYSENPLDPGGATNYGITQRTFDQWQRSHDVEVYPVRNIPIETSIDIYRDWYWRVIQGDHIKHEKSALVIFDIGVNQGTRQSIKNAQRALNAIAYNLKIDGIIGPKTLDALNQTHFMSFTGKFLYYAMKRYLDIMDGRPSLLVWRHIWNNRLESLRLSVARRGDNVF